MLEVLSRSANEREARKTSLLRRLLRKVRFLSRRYRELRPSLGWYGAIQYVIHEGRNHRQRLKKPYTLYSKDAKFPLYVRPGTSDISVFHQIFIEREYSCLDDLNNVDLIIDCGANVGYSSAYFLSRFRTCKIYCIEPDTSNFKAMTENLAPYGDRAKLIHAGVWSHSTELKISDRPYRDGKEWSVQVEECKPGEKGEFRAVDIESILADSGCNRISILKVDIEGAEAVVFSRNIEHWLKHVDNIVIELHDDSMFGPASELVVNAISTQGNFAISRSGELTVFKSLALPRMDS